MTIFISWGTTKPNEKLVALMLEKLKAFHIVRKPEFVFGHRWPEPDGTAKSYDPKCWHIRDDLCQANSSSRGLECAQALLEGLNEGFALAKGKQQCLQFESSALAAMFGITTPKVEKAKAKL